MGPKLVGEHNGEVNSKPFFLLYILSRTLIFSSFLQAWFSAAINPCRLIKEGGVYCLYHSVAKKKKKKKILLLEKKGCVWMYR
jgi:heme/copper-type cytochrome/quinol oxidase subunit 3